MYDAIIIDSGCNKIQQSTVKSISLIEDSGIDKIGHGSSVIGIIHKLAPSARLLSIKITNSYNNNQINLLANALEYIISSKIKTRIINISLGFTSSEGSLYIQRLINKLCDIGVVITSALNNDGYLSYPAIFQNVIGIGTSTECKNPYDYIYINNSLVNIFGCSSYFRTVDHNNVSTLLKGTSFACAAITALIINELNNRPIDTFLSTDEVKNTLLLNAKRTLHCKSFKSKSQSSRSFVDGIHKAIVFPFNKEIHALAKFEELLSFEINGYYDHRLSPYVNKKISDIMPYISNPKIIKEYDNINWNDDFDTVICGHCDVISGIYKFDILADVIDKCEKFDKNIYCFDYINTKLYSTSKMFCPAVNESNIPFETCGKLALISKPVLGIWGTSSQQGKFTLQLKLRDKFKKHGYKVSQVGTEPSGYLFGMEFVFPYGYGNSVSISDYNTVLTLNSEMRAMELNECDIIITGAQSGTIPYNPSYASNLCFQSHSYLIGTMPDAVLLCVNVFDDINYIVRSINYIEGVTSSTVIALCIFPFRKSFSLISKVNVTEKELYQYKSLLMENLNIKVFFIDDIDNIYLSIIDYLKE